MKLRDVINEMSLPLIKNAEEAVDYIKQAYNAAVVKKQPNPDLYGALHASAKFLAEQPNAASYERYTKMAVAAKKAMDANRKGLAPQQAQFTTVRGKDEA